MNHVINNSIFRPEVFLPPIPGWSWQINGYPVLMIFWNIVLAAISIWLAYLVVQDIKKGQKNVFRSILLCLAWLFMVPNTAYLLTETRHSLGLCSVEIYNNVCAVTAWSPLFFFLFAGIGWVSFIWSVRPIEAAIAKAYGQNTSVWFVVASLLLISLGVLLGLVNRFNSWEILTDPLTIISSGVLYILDLTSLQNYFMMTFLLFTLYLAGSHLLIRLPWEKKTSKS